MSQRPTQEQPPADTPANLKEWLVRLRDDTLNGLNTAKDFITSGQLPGYIYDGLVQFFSGPIPPDIDHAGPWVVINGEWRPLVSWHWNGSWAASEYHYHDVVRDDGWLMVCVNPDGTTDRAAPTPTGPPEWALEDAQPWDADGGAPATVVYTGHTYTFKEAGYFRGARIWVPELSDTTNYSIVSIRNPNSANPILTRIPEPVLNEDSWTIIAATTELVLPGEELLIYIDAYNQDDTSGFSDGWNRSPNTNAIADPGVAGWHTNNATTQVAINEQSLGDSYATQLSGVGAGARIEVVQANDATKNMVWIVNGAGQDYGTYWHFGLVTYDGSGPNGEPDVGAPCTVTVIIPSPETTKYKQDLSYWATNEPAWADIEGFKEYNGVPQAGNESNAFGIDINFEPLSKSDDWEVVMTPSGGGGAGTTYWNPEDDNIVNSNQRAVIVRQKLAEAGAGLNIEGPLGGEFQVYGAEAFGVMGIRSLNAGMVFEVPATATMQFNRAGQGSFFVIYTNGDIGFPSLKAPSGQFKNLQVDDAGTIRVEP